MRVCASALRIESFNKRVELVDRLLTKLIDLRLLLIDVCLVPVELVHYFVDCPFVQHTLP